MIWVFYIVASYFLVMQGAMMLGKPEVELYQVRGGLYFLGVIIAVGVAEILKKLK